MITDDDLDRMVMSVRPSDTAAWSGFGAARAQLLDELLSHPAGVVSDSGGPAESTTVVDLRSVATAAHRRRVRAGLGTAAAVLVIAATVAVVGGSDRSTVVEPSATTEADGPATTAASSVASVTAPAPLPAAATSLPATTLAATPRTTPVTMAPPEPWAPTGPVLDLLALPRCTDAAAIADLAAWAVQQLSFMVALDPARAEVLDPADALTRTPIDTLAAEHASCTLAIEVGEAEAVAALAPDGTTLARTVRHADLGLRPAVERVPQGDDWPTWTLGNGVMFNGFATRTIDIEPVTFGVESFGDVLAIQLAEPLLVDRLVNRFAPVTTTGPATAAELGVGRPPVMWQPTLVPDGFGECVPHAVTGEYTRYCRGHETIDVLNGPWEADGAEATTIAGREVQVMVDTSGTTVGGQEGVYLRVSSSTVPFDELAATYASIPETDPQLHDLRSGTHDLGGWWQTIDRLEWTDGVLAALGRTGEPREVFDGAVRVWSVLPVGTAPGTEAGATLSVTYSAPERARLLGPQDLVHPVDLGSIDGLVGESAAALGCGGITVQIEFADALDVDLATALQTVLAQLPDC